MPSLNNPILNSPFVQPQRHWALDEFGVPTGAIVETRRGSEYVLPVPPAQHQTRQGELELDAENGRRTSNDYVDALRAKVGAWRALASGQQARSVTPVTAALLRHWRDPSRERRLFFCQIEALETMIWLTEVAPRAEMERIRAWNKDANPELLRLALKLATGAGKTTVMGMLIAWQTLNRARISGSSRFTDRFLVITPGITIKDRLRVLQPSDPANIYVALDLVPPEMRDELQRARVVITNYQAFRKRDTMEAPKLTKEVLGGRSGPVVTQETDGQMIRRVCADLLRSGERVMVLNDEAHHCYRERESTRAERMNAEERGEIKRGKEMARLWMASRRYSGW